MKNDVLYAGYGRSRLTPDEPTGLAGYAHPNRIFKEVKDDVYSSCTAFKDSDGNMALIFTLDLHSLSGNSIGPMKKAVSEAVGVDPDNIIFNVTHNHAAPCGPVVTCDFIIERILPSARDAVADLSECELYAGSKEVYGFNFCRRFLTKEGKLFDYATRPMIWQFETKADNVIPMIKITRAGKKDIVLANFAAHCDTIYGCEDKHYTLSADYVGATRAYFESHCDAYLSIQMGACGDLNPVDTPYRFYTFPGTDVYGKHLALAFIDGAKNLTKKLEGNKKIKATTTTFKALVDHSRDDKAEICQKIWDIFSSGDKTTAVAMIKENGFTDIYECDSILNKSRKGEYNPFELSAISIGDIGFAVAPYEMFNDTGVQIKNGSKFRLTFVCAYSNGSEGYIPTEKAFSHGGYEVTYCAYAPDTATKIGDTLVGLLDEIHE